MNEKSQQPDNELKICRAELQKSTELLSLLTETSKVITSVVELKKVVQQITDKATELSGAQFGVFFYNTTRDERKQLNYITAGGPEKLLAGEGTSWAIRIFVPDFNYLQTTRFDDVTRNIDGTQLRNEIAQTGAIKSYLAVPVLNPANKEVIGGIYLCSDLEGVFGKKEERLVEGIALQGAIAMGNAQLFEENKKTETLLNEQREAYRSIFDSTFHAVVILNRQAEIVEVNEMACKMFMKPASEILGIHIKQVLNSYNPLFLSVDKLEDQYLNFPSQGSRSNGKSIQLDCRARVFNYRNDSHILLMMRDITEQVKTELALKKSRNFSETIAEASPVVLWLSNEFGDISYISNLWFKWTNCEKSKENDTNWIESVHEDDREHAWLKYREAFNKKCILDMDVRLKNNCQAKWVNIHAEPNLNDELFFGGMAGSIMDITIRKETQAKLNFQNKKAKDELENLVKERTSELEKTNYELLQFSSIASHDLKEPVRKISVFGRLLSDRLKGTLTADNEKYLGNIIQSAGRMMKLINDLLTFSRLSHVAETTFVKVNLNEIIEFVLQDLELAISEKKATVNVDTMPEMFGIPVQLSQVFQNLISNSLKFHEPSRPLVIEITNQPEDENNFRITYTDNGIGFNESFKDKIFNVFQRLHPKDAYEGTGIGLSIVKKIVSLHKGHVSAIGTEGKGASFELLLPYNANKTVSAAAVYQ